MRNILELVTVLALLILIVSSSCAGLNIEPTSTPIFTPISTTSPTPIPPTQTFPPSPTLSDTSTPLPPTPIDLVGPFTLHSEAFAAGANIPIKYTFAKGTQCRGENYSPPLIWEGVPAGTQSLAMLVVDPDGKNWKHWVQFNIPADITNLPEAIGGPTVGVKGRNDFNALGYGGPCPPSGTHRYVFTLYALDTLLPLEEGASFTKVIQAMEGHILAEAELIGTRSK